MSLYSRIVGAKKFDDVSRFNGYLEAQRRLSIAFSSAQIIYAAFNMLFGGCAFWRSESRAAEEIFARSQKAGKTGPGLLVISKLTVHTQRLQEMKERLNQSMERFVVLKDFENACGNFEEVVSETGEFLKANDRQYAESNPWRIETEALREGLRQALSIMRFKEEEYIKEYATCPISGIQKLIDRIQMGFNGLIEEKERLGELVARDVFYPLRDPERMFGRLADEIEETKRLLKRMISEYGDVYRGNRFWQSEIEELNSRELASAIEVQGKAKKVDLGRAERETLSALDEKLKELVKDLSSARKRLEVMASQNIFGLLARREKGHKLLQKEIAEFEEILFRLNRRFKHDYSWAIKRERLETFLKEAEQALEMSEMEDLGRNKLIRAVLRLESKAAAIQREKERLKSLAGQEAPEDAGPKEDSLPKPDRSQDELSELLSGLIREVNAFDKRAKTLREAFALIEELKKKFNALWVPPSSEQAGGNGGHRRAATDRPATVTFTAPEG